jgi:acetoin utilization protein AcuB
MAAATLVTMLMPPVSRYMTVHPYAIGPRDKLSSARRLMATRKVHHLPVLEENRLIGIISDRDVHPVHPLHDVRVEETMTEDVLEVRPDTPLDEVLGQMEAKNCGSAVVVSDTGVEGIFTTHDALRALGDLLRRTVEEEP